MHGDEVRKSFKGECWTTVPDPDPSNHRAMADKYSLSVVYGDTSHGLARNGRITYGGNSGHQAIHLAYNFGAARILLLGYDFGGNSHWFGDHPQRLQSGHNYSMWLTEMVLLAEALRAKGVEVINCTRRSAITCLPTMSIDDVEDYCDTALDRASHA